jgi:hypothetical protein
MRGAEPCRSCTRSSRRTETCARCSISVGRRNARKAFRCRTHPAASRSGEGIGHRDQPELLVRPAQRAGRVDSPSNVQVRESGYETGNGRKPTSLPPQPGCWIVAPLLPHELQRARCLSRSLDTSAPQRMTATAQASGAWCWQRSHHSHTQGVVRCSSPSVGRGPNSLIREVRPIALTMCGCLASSWFSGSERTAFILVYLCGREASTQHDEGE